MFPTDKNGFKWLFKCDSYGKISAVRTGMLGRPLTKANGEIIDLQLRGAIKYEICAYFI